MRLQIIVDEDLGHKLQAEAHDLGFSTSSYLRYLIKKSLEHSQMNGLDLGIKDFKEGNIEEITLEKHKKQLKG